MAFALATDVRASSAVSSGADLLTFGSLSSGERESLQPVPGVSPYDPNRPNGGALIDPVTRTVQWLNWGNMNSPCFQGFWRRC